MSTAQGKILTIKQRERSKSTDARLAQLRANAILSDAELALHCFDDGFEAGLKVAAQILRAADREAARKAKP